MRPCKRATTQGAFPTRGESLRAARSRHQVSLREVIAGEITDAEVQIEEAERNAEYNQNDDELFCDDVDDVYVYEEY